MLRKTLFENIVLSRLGVHRLFELVVFVFDNLLDLIVLFFLDLFDLDILLFDCTLELDDLITRLYSVA